MIMFLTLILILLLPICRRCGFISKKILKVYIFFRDMFFWNGLIRLFLEGYLEIIVSILMNMSFFVYSTSEELTNQNIISFTTACFFTVAFLVIFFFSLFYLLKKGDHIYRLERYKPEEFEIHNEYIGALHEGMDTRKLAGKLWTSIFILRRTIVALSLVFLINLPQF